MNTITVCAQIATPDTLTLDESISIPLVRLIVKQLINRNDLIDIEGYIVNMIMSHLNWIKLPERRIQHYKIYCQGCECSMCTKSKSIICTNRRKMFYNICKCCKNTAVPHDNCSCVEISYEEPIPGNLILYPTQELVNEYGRSIKSLIDYLIYVTSIDTDYILRGSEYVIIYIKDSKKRLYLYTGDVLTKFMLKESVVHYHIARRAAESLIDNTKTIILQLTHELINPDPYLNFLYITQEDE